MESGHLDHRRPGPVPPADGAVAAAQQWMLSAVDQPITVAQMATRAHMSPRTFHRAFPGRHRAHAGAWLQEQRSARTKELLESTELGVEEIARQVGLGTPANLRAHFRRATGISPMRHRRLFGAR